MNKYLIICDSDEMFFRDEADAWKAYDELIGYKSCVSQPEKIEKAV